MYKILEDNRNFGKCNNKIDNEKYLIQTCSQAKSSGTKLPEVYGVQKELNPNLRPEKQHIISKQIREATGRSRQSRIEKEET